MTRLRLPLFMLAAASLCALLAVSSRAEDEPKTAPPEKPVTGDPESEVTALIDREIAKVYERDGLTPAPRSSDEEFLRRVYFDTVSAAPAPDEILAFLDDKDEHKREKLIDKLVDDPRFGGSIADQWTTILIGRNNKVKGGGENILAVWLARQVNKDVGFDQVIYDLITATGAMSENPAAAYWAGRKEERVPDFAGLSSKQFTGVQIQCAQCHKHPYENITTDDFAGVASFFAAVQVRYDGKKEPADPTVMDQKVRRMSSKDLERLKNADPKKVDPKQKEKLEERIKYSSPKYLFGDEANLDDSTLWRSAYAKWVIGPENKQTPRYLANRFWSFIFGLGLLNPVDDFNSFNKPTHPELLEALGSEMRASKFSVKRFYREVLKTKTYQLSSSGAKRTGGLDVEVWHYAAYPVKQLSPEQFFGELVGLSSTPDALKEARRRSMNPYTRLRQQIERNGADGVAERKKEKKAEGKDGKAEEGKKPEEAPAKPEMQKDGEPAKPADEKKPDEMKGEMPEKKAPLTKEEEQAQKKDEKSAEKKAENKGEKTYDMEALKRLEAIIDEMPDAWYMRRQMCQSFAARSDDDEMNEAETFTLTIDQALQVMNGQLTSKLSEYKKGLPLYDVLRSNKEPAERVLQLYLRVLARKPSEDETKRTLGYVADAVKGGSKVEQAWEDVLFALLMTTEFATNH